jgi:hypothetical protein
MKKTTMNLVITSTMLSDLVVAADAVAIPTLHPTVHFKIANIAVVTTTLLAPLLQRILPRMLRFFRTGSTRKEDHWIDTVCLFEPGTGARDLERRRE